MIRLLALMAVLAAAFSLGCTEEPQQAAEAPPAAAGGQGLQPQGGEMMPPPDAPNAEDIVGSKAGG
jgi:hypothetical protein